MARFYVAEQISPRIGETPEGFLVCYDVPIARTGVMVYNKSQVDLMPWLNDFEGDEAGNVFITRDEAEVFRPETVASFEGKPVTIDHPGELVSPETFGTLTKGNAQDIRRGTDAQKDLMVGDLLVGDAEAIAYVKSRELREISCGYDADYEKIDESHGRQTNIIGNHIALVKKGRAGARCVIMDSEKKEEKAMSLKDRLKKLLGKTVDEMSEEELKELEKEKKTADADEMPEWAKGLKEVADCFKDGVEQTIGKAMDAWWKKHKDAEDGETEEEKKKREEEEKKKAEEGGTEDKKKTKDSASFKDTVSRAEILAPGFTVDGEMLLGETKRTVLKEAYKNEDTKKTIEAFTGGAVVDFTKLSGRTVDTAFIGVSEILGQKNNSKLHSRGRTGDFSTPLDPAAINKANAEFWQKNQGR